MSKRHYRRLKCNTYNIATAENIKNRSIDFVNTDNLQNSSDVIEYEITDVNRDLHQAANVIVKNELSQQCFNISDNEDVANDSSNDNSSNLENLLCSIAYTFDNDKNTGHTNFFATSSIRDNLINWTAQFQISHVAITALLSILRKHGFDSYLPKNSKTLMRTPRYTNVRKVAPGEYFHNGLRSGIMAFLRKSRDDIDLIEVQISIDGLPISNSSTNQL
jgi:hypothetical protein